MNTYLESAVKNWAKEMNRSVYNKVSAERSRIMDEYESGAEYTRDEYNFDDGYISALTWVMEILDGEEKENG